MSYRRELTKRWPLWVHVSLCVIMACISVMYQITGEEPPALFGALLLLVLAWSIFTAMWVSVNE